MAASHLAAFPVSDVIQSLTRRWHTLLIVGLIALRLAQAETRDSGWLTVAMALTVAGTLMNLVVIVANRGMPAAVSEDEIAPAEQQDYHPLTPATRLAFLADWIPLGDYLISPGDIVLAAALACIGLDWLA